MIVLPDIHTILLDMDGVLVDDISMFSQQDRLIKDMKNHLNTLKIFGMKESYVFPLIQEAIKNKGFLKANPTSFAFVIKDILFPFWKEKGITVEILSSTMKTNPLRKDLEQQKLQWLANNNLDNLKVNLVEGSAKKQEFAKPGVLLIDDYDRTIGQFISSGGYGIQYTTLTEVMSKLKLIGLSTES